MSARVGKQPPNLKCLDCPRTYYSAAPDEIVANERCDCGGPLVRVDAVDRFLASVAGRPRCGRRRRIR